MDRVASTMWLIADVEAGRVAPDAAFKAIAAISRAPAAPIWLFALAAASGAVALSVIFGVEHFLPAMLIIFVSAGLGAIVRRALARVSANIFVQLFCAALLAGIIGAIALQYNLSSSLRLVAVCPCMVLVAGPHFLNSALDLIAGRIQLGAARLIFAGLSVVAISMGWLLGLKLFGASLPVDPPGRIPPLWEDVIAAGIAVAAYSVFFSTPLSMLPWPVAVGMLAHALVGRTVGIGVQRWRRRTHRLPRCWTDSHTDLTPHAHAVRGHRLCVRGVVDPGRVPVQDGKRPCPDCRRLSEHVGALKHYR
jgi:hypothetical protein